METVHINGDEKKMSKAEMAELWGPPVVAEEVPIVVFPADLWRRATDDEAQDIMDAMTAQPVRIRKIFETARSYQSDDELWPLLESAAQALFGADRAAELLAPST